MRAQWGIQHPHGGAGGVDQIGDVPAQMFIGMQIPDRVKPGAGQYGTEEQARRSVSAPAILLPADPKQNHIAPCQVIQRRDAPVAAYQHVRLEDVCASHDRKVGLAAAPHLAERGAPVRWGAYGGNAGKQGLQYLPHRIHDDLIAQIVAGDRGVEYVHQHAAVVAFFRSKVRVHGYSSGRGEGRFGACPAPAAGAFSQVQTSRLSG